MTRAAALLVFSYLTACDDGGAGGGHLAPPADARGPASPDLSHDASVDSSRRDGGLADARAVDGTATIDAAPDAVSDAARDAEAPWVPTEPCVGVHLPPPRESPDGQEVCNYRDDDQDGLVDEGFRYEFLGEPVGFVGSTQTVASAFDLRWAGDGFGVGWQGNGVMNFVKIAPDGCPTSRHHKVDQNPDDPAAVIVPGSEALAFSGSRFALVFSQARRAGVGGDGSTGTFLQLFEQDGRRVGNPVDVVPDEFHVGFNDVVALDDGFGVFTVVVDRSGGPPHGVFSRIADSGSSAGPALITLEASREDGTHVSELIGLARNGDGIGLAWASQSFAFGDRIYFTEWGADGEARVPPTVIAPGIGTRTGLAVLGSSYLIAFEAEGGAKIALVDTSEPVSDRVLNLEGTAVVNRISATDSEILVLGAIARRTAMQRRSARGDPLGVETSAPRDTGWLAVRARRDGVLGALLGTNAPGADPYAGWLWFAALGCAVEGGD